MEQNNVSPDFITKYSSEYEFAIMVRDIGLLNSIKKIIDKHGVSAYQLIVNPSDDIISYAIGYNASIIDEISSPSKEMIFRSILASPEIYVKKFEHLLREDDFILLVKMPAPSIYGIYGYELIKYLSNPSDKIKWVILKDHPFAAEYIEDMTSEMCEYAVLHLSFLPIELISKIKNFTPEIVERIISSYYCPLQYIPQSYYNSELISSAIEKNPSNIEFVPEEFWNQRLFDRATDKDKRLLRFVPEIYQTEALVKKCLRFDPMLMRDCINITNEIVVWSFKNDDKKSKKTRLDFVNNYAEDDIVRIARVYGNILQILTLDKKTERVIKTALGSNGWALQYVEEQKEEYIQIALKSEPRATKYIIVKDNI